MRRLSLLGVLLLLLAACAGEEDPGLRPGDPESRPPEAVEVRAGNQRLGLTLPDGTDGSYLLHAPPVIAADRPLPLVLVFHGAPGTPQEMVRVTGFNGLADDEGFLVVYPDAFDEAGDVAALVDDVADRVAVDPRRIYAAGFSRGALTTYLLAAGLADRIAAFAPVSGIAADLALNGPASLIAIEGEADDFASSWSTVNREWSRAAGCDRAEVVEATIAGRVAARSEAECRSGSAHVVYRVAGMGHEWLRPVTRVIWTFFKAHPLGG